MRIVLIALLMLSFAVPAYARGGGGKRSNTDQQASSAESQKKSRAEEKAYKDALKRIPDAKPADPWGKMR